MGGGGCDCHRLDRAFSIRGVEKEGDTLPNGLGG